MLRRRVIPCLLVSDGGLVKTTGFGSPTYLGDPINAVRIFNEKEVPELVVLDIRATQEGRGPNLDLVRDLAAECFMPLCYGGGVTSVDQVGTILGLGVEKVCVNSATYDDPDLITESARRFGSQSLMVSIDAKGGWPWGLRAYSHGATKRQRIDPVAHARQMEAAGAGEVLITSVRDDGRMTGYNVELIRSVSEAVKIPVVASGGAGCIEDFGAAVHEGLADAVAAGSLFVFEGPHRAVLISYPDRADLSAVL